MVPAFQPVNPGRVLCRRSRQDLLKRNSRERALREAFGRIQQCRCGRAAQVLVKATAAGNSEQDQPSASERQ
jgi:hypothetical protein